MATIKIKLKHSAIGCNKRQKATVKCLGFTRTNQVRELKDSPAVRGALLKLAHILEVVG